MGDWLGKRVELDVTNIAHGGVSVARLDGRVVFVSDAIPGERVVAIISDDTKTSFWRADTVEVSSPSIHRQQQIWQEASIERSPEDRAGGAEFGHIVLSHQRELKRQVLIEALDRMAGIATDVAVTALPGDDESLGTGWRTRVRLHVDEAGRAGPYAARSHRVIPVTSLPLATAQVNLVAPLDRRFSPGTRVELVSAAGAKASVLVGTRTSNVITEKVGNREFRLAENGFWQVHRYAADTLSVAVRDAIDDARFDPQAANLDLYGGVGLLAAAVADKFGASTSVVTVEADRIASEFAASNLSDLQGAVAVGERVERWLAHQADGSAAQKARFRTATAVLDPPRSGAGRVLESLVALKPAQVVYVACDPIAFARDARLLSENGYTLVGLSAFDLFPNTHHGEAVGTFLRE
jgi:tRNA/tmRNA/rRNA uracil-C5-methylase (TrmA/RlmC/RlmD family)